MISTDAASFNVTSYRVIYGDTDKMGIVYYANYLRFFERGRCEFLRQLGAPYGEIEARGIHFPVVEANCRYTKPARYDDLVLIETKLDSVSRAKLVFNYRILREGEDTPLAAGSTKHACIDDAGKLLRIPIDLVRLLEQFVEADGADQRHPNQSH
jgi:acyl-CoA thioester hydrolase